eukprot:TRINITY_DN1880_c0_g1_i6.p1 TRINITY_DN1880_c0_g1~~TRINITY_DN1880_c0_g1_i6.p1  ORF type:complete len:704 (+),score=230.62 TRINITY_DN1880_c0_g1_i6:152-2263(+)
MAAGVLNAAISAARLRGQAANVQGAKVKLSELFITWMALPEMQDLVATVSHDHHEKGRLSGGELRKLLEVDTLTPAVGAAGQLSWRHADGHTDDRLGANQFAFASPPRSPRQSPSRGPGRQPAAGGGLLVDELEAAHRQGAMSPHGSPRSGPAAFAGKAQSPTGMGGQRRGQSPPEAGLPACQVPRPMGLGGAAAQEDGARLPHSRHEQVSPRQAFTGSDQLRQPARGGAPLQSKDRPSGEPRLRLAPFYFPHGKPCSREAHEKEVRELKKFFESKKASAKAPASARSASGRRSSQDSRLDKTYNQRSFPELVTKVCLLPKWMSNVVFRRVLCWEPPPANHDREKEMSLQVNPATTVVTYQKFKDFYDLELAGKSKELRLFDMIKWDRKRSHIAREDLRPIVEEVLLVHPGLEFLKNTPDFQERYTETVQIRILFSANTKDDGKLSWGEFQKSSLPTVLHALDQEPDINVSNRTEYFSYEHFYVLYCKFWELDTDHDFFISKEDLSKYGNYSLTNAIIDRVFAGKGRKSASPNRDRMAYEDFVWFCLCEEDKGTPQSLEYWFRCVDLDSDGILSGYELQHFFQEQKERMESSYQETIAYEDILCQMIDMIHPKDPKAIRLSDLKACKLSGNFFNSLFNLNKFIAFEQRDPFVAHAEKQMPEKTDWDRFAKIEYERMSHEAGEQEEGMGDDAGNTSYWRTADGS